jgi:hypothetical protein
LEFCICVQTYLMKNSFRCSAKPKVCISFASLSNIAVIMKTSTVYIIYFSSSLCLTLLGRGGGLRYEVAGRSSRGSWAKGRGSWRSTLVYVSPKIANIFL